MAATDDWSIVKSVLEHRRTSKPTERFPRYVVSKPAAKRLVAALGLKMPRAGYEMTIAHDPDGNLWVLANLAGSSFHLMQYYK